MDLTLSCIKLWLYRKIRSGATGPFPYVLLAEHVRNGPSEQNPAITSSWQFIFIHYWSSWTLSLMCDAPDLLEIHQEPFYQLRLVTYLKPKLIR